MREINLLVKWIGQPNWHLVQSRNHGATECGARVPFKEMASEYAEAGRIENVKGICFKCFHERCINDQDPAMWTIYYGIVEKNLQNYPDGSISTNST